MTKVIKNLRASYKRGSERVSACSTEAPPSAKYIWLEMDFGVKNIFLTLYEKMSFTTFSTALVNNNSKLFLVIQLMPKF